MKFPSTALLALAASSASAHTLMSEIYINGRAQGDATCVHMPTNPSTANNPIGDLASADMACGVNGVDGVARVCSIDSGSTLTFEFRESAQDATKGSIDDSHKGSCAVYLKKVDSAVADNAAGDGWFKIWHDGYDESAGKWCTEKLIDNKGRLSVVIPEALKGGYYIVRSELLALHNADKTPSDPQFYIGCTQIFLRSSGSSFPSSSQIVSIPGYVSASDASVTFNIWEEPMALPYIVPGPAVYKPVSNGASRLLQSEATTKQTEGLPPKNCILSNANWCGTELSKYSTEDGCWSASAACWKQCDTCYDSAPPTGSTNCKIWEDKCQTINDQCDAGNFSGPPDYMKTLTPAARTIDVPAVIKDASDSKTVATSKAHIVATTSLPSTLATVAKASLPVISSSVIYQADVATVTVTVTVTVTDAVATTSTKVLKRAPEPQSVEQPILGGGSVLMSVSADGHCGGSTTCLTSRFGNCCGMVGDCGSDIGHCGHGCQGNYGMCAWGINGRDVKAAGSVKREPVAGSA